MSSSFEHRASSLQLRASSIELRTSSIMHRTSCTCFEHRVSSIEKEGGPTFSIELRVRPILSSGRHWVADGANGLAAGRPTHSLPGYNFACNRMHASNGVSWDNDVGGPAWHYCRVATSLFVHLSEPFRDVGGPALRVQHAVLRPPSSLAAA